MYYAFFTDPAKPFAGEVELRGLKPGTYNVTDYVEGKNLGSVQAENGKTPRLKADFKDHLLLEVSAK
jgi:hypothetical protein